ncbi:MAG: maltotransferase domain-containing protein, partial [Longimicrobiales bacterium]
MVIEGVRPEIDCGRFPIKRSIGEAVTVEADVFTDGHDSVACRLLWKHRSARAWKETPMAPVGNDRWRASFHVEQLGRYQYTLDGWLDPYYTWRHDLAKRVAAGQDVDIDLLIGADLLEAAAARARGRDRQTLLQAVETLRSDRAIDRSIVLGLDEALEGVARKYPDRDHAAAYGRTLEVVVDPERARFSSWYELFPRSTSPDPRRHGTFRDTEARLPYLRELGFDVLYLPPIHPIGETKRKGRNNVEEGRSGDVGSPWAIGSKEGGHKSIHP